jgi:hypothetical protein
MDLKLMQVSISPKPFGKTPVYMVQREAIGRFKML